MQNLSSTMLGAASMALLMAALPAQAHRGDRQGRVDPGFRGHWQPAVVVRPYFPPARFYPRPGLVVRYRPALWTLVTVGAVGYVYANGVYYREHAGGGYEVVQPPVDDAPDIGFAPAPYSRYVYPRQGQSAEQQASDEYGCHRWAVQQTGFDPSGVAAGHGRGASAEQRVDYPRARDACLEGRGYSMR